MFDYVDKRTEQERQRDFEWGEKRRQNGVLSRGFTEQLRKRLAKESMDVGLVGSGMFGDGELLVQANGVTYKIQVCVAADDEE